jgi:hypothetical protein
MFTTGQMIFGVLFFVAFVAVIILSYRKDIKIHRKHYKGSIYVLVGFLLFIVLLFFIKAYLK